MFHVSGIQTPRLKFQFCYIRVSRCKGKPPHEHRLVSVEGDVKTLERMDEKHISLCAFNAEASLKEGDYPFDPLSDTS